MVSVARAPHAPLANGPPGGAPPPPPPGAPPPGHHPGRAPAAGGSPGSQPGSRPGSHAPSPPPASPSVIGNVFVQQYYSIMAATLDELYKFYNNGSTLHVCGPGVPPVPGVDVGADQTVRTQAGIHARFQQLGYRGKRCEVATVDSSHSIGGSVVVMVTGAIVGGDDRRAFTQTFVLAPQEGGYYVLNDIVRFVDAGPAPPPAPRAAPPPQVNVAAPEPPAAPPPPPAASAAAVILEQIGAKIPEKKETEAKETESKETEAKESEAKESEAKESEGPTTYASIAAKMRAAAAAKAPVAAAKPSHAAASSASDAKAATTASSATGASSGEKMTHDPVTAVFVRDIPQSADEASIEAAFAKIGPIAAVTIRTAKRQPDANADANGGGAPGRYAFVQFEKAESAQAAIEATVEMDGRALSVEEKREGGHNNRNQGGGNNRRNDARAQQKPGAANGGGNNRREGTRGPRRDGEGGKHQHQGERRAQGGPRREGGDRRQPARQPAAAKA